MLYRAKANLNLYSSPELNSLATQARAGRLLRLPPDWEVGKEPLLVTLVEDDYPAWLNPADEASLAPTDEPYRYALVSEAEIQARLPAVIAFAEAAYKTPNQYLWGGTVAPHYDCSGLMQAAFWSQGIQLPRDAYQQEAFVQPVALGDLQVGDLVFFGPAERAKHVGLYLGEGRYIHSSGQEIGRNGIGIDELRLDGEEVSRNYFCQWRTGGRVVESYRSKHINS
jgi:cell wall-associated NlpC family hydrolase